LLPVEPPDDEPVEPPEDEPVEPPLDLLPPEPLLPPDEPVSLGSEAGAQAPRERARTATSEDFVNVMRDLQNGLAERIGKPWNGADGRAES
jgi:hypothetical protein